MFHFNTARPKKRFSQNFLHDPNIARKIADACRIQSNDLVVEIGCGQGFLTERLLAKSSVVHGVEVDRALIELLKDRFKAENKFILHTVDILEFNFLELEPDPSGKNLKLVGNLPYHITSPIIFKCLDHSSIIDTATFMVQKEVARRITAKPDTKDYGILSVFCQYHAACKLLFDVSPNAFYPKPKVISSIVQLTFRPREIEAENYPWFKAIVKKSFNQRRKMLRNSLSEFLASCSLDFDLERRPETLTIDEFILLSQIIPPIILQKEK
jgi:16S rRNA (adenine1518-N6/adenine1519-N6)-dimethyltransferase